jgi:hypothetical protein
MEITNYRQGLRLPDRLSEPEVPTPQSPLIYVKEELRWEYKRLERNLESESAPTEDDLNALGNEGWELVSTLAHKGQVYLYFKRLAE